MEEDDVDYGDVVYTHAGDLDFEYIFFGILPYSMRNDFKQFDKMIQQQEGDISATPINKC